MSVHLSLLGYLQVDGTGSCLFSMIKRSRSVHTATAQGAPIFLIGILGEWWSTIWSTTGSRSMRTNIWP